MSVFWRWGLGCVAATLEFLEWHECGNCVWGITGLRWAWSSDCGGYG